MSRLSRRRILLAAVVSIGFGLAGSTAAIDQTTFVASSFASCTVRNECPPLEPCEAQEFQLIGGCNTGCSIGDAIPNCFSGDAASAISDSWTVGGLFAALLQPGGDTPDIQVNFDFFASRPTPLQLDVTGSVFSSVTFGAGFEPGQVEVSVFRFSGDPTVFDGVRVSGVSDLVGLGLIDADDVLFSQVVPVPLEGSVPFNSTVDVTSVPSEEIVLFASHSGPAVSVPALSAWGLLLLVVVFVPAATWALRRRLPASERVSSAD